MFGVDRGGLDSGAAPVASPGGGSLAPPSPPLFFSRDRAGSVAAGMSSTSSRASDVGWYAGLTEREDANTQGGGPPLSSQERLATAWAKADRESEAWYLKTRGVSGKNLSESGTPMDEDTKPAGRKPGAVASIAETFGSDRFPGGFPSKPENTQLHGEHPISNNLVSVRCVDVNEHELCGSTVGSSGKFCTLLKIYCKTKSHHKKGPSFLDSLKNKGLSKVLFINAPMSKAQQGKEDAPLQAFQDPYLDAASLDSSKVEELLSAKIQPVLVWTSLFSLIKSETQTDFEPSKKNIGAALEAIGEVDARIKADSWSIAKDDDLELATMAALKNKAVHVAHTPAKGLRLEDVELPSPMEPLDLRPVSAETTNVREILVHNTTLLGQVAQASSNQLVTLRARQLEQNKLLNTLVNKVNLMSGLLGAPPAGAGMVSVWQALSELQDSSLQPDNHSEESKDWRIETMDLHQRVQALTTELEDAKRKSDDFEKDRKMLKLLPEEVKKLIWHKLKKVENTIIDASDYFQGGGRVELENHIRYLTDTLHLVLQQGRPSSSHLAGSGVDAQEIVEMKRLLSKMEEQEKTQQIRITDLEARSEMQAVEIEGVQFSSPAQVKAFVISNNVSGEVLKFVDAMSFIEMATTVSHSYTDHIEVQYKGSRSSMERPSDQKALYSF